MMKKKAPTFWFLVYQNSVPCLYWKRAGLWNAIMMDELKALDALVDDGYTITHLVYWMRRTMVSRKIVWDGLLQEQKGREIVLPKPTICYPCGLVFLFNWKCKKSHNTSILESIVAIWVTLRGRDKLGRVDRLDPSYLKLWLLGAQRWRVLICILSSSHYLPRSELQTFLMTIFLLGTAFGNLRK